MLVGWDTEDAVGWYIGRVHSASISARDKSKTPAANFVVKYTARHTNNALNGNVACELSLRMYGVGKWWMLLGKSLNVVCILHVLVMYL